MLTACGGSDSDRIEKVVVKVFPSKYPNDRLLKFDEISKEFGVKKKECLIADNGKDKPSNYFAFVERNGKIEVWKLLVHNKDEAIMYQGNHEFDYFKNNYFDEKEFKECF